MIRIDTNYIVRYLINDNIEMANIAEEILITKDVFISNEVLAEVIYVLFGVYKISREDIANLSNMTTSNAIRTLSTFASEKVIAIDGRKIKILDIGRLERISKLG